MLDEIKELLEKGELIEAERQLVSIGSDSIDYSEARSLLSSIAFTCGHATTARQFILDALERSNEPVALNLGLAAIEKSLGNTDEALSILRKISNEEPNDLQIKLMLGNDLIANGYLEEALTYYKELASVSNVYKIVYSNILSDLGELEEAERVILEIIADEPLNIHAVVNLLSFTSYKENGVVDVDKLVELSTSNAIDIQSRALLCNTVGKIKEKQKLYKESFEFYDSACVQQRSIVTNDADQLLQHKNVMLDIETFYTKELLQGFESDRTSPMIFIFGMPRSGSTLVEQILTCSNDVDTLGETINISHEIEHLSKRILLDKLGDDFPYQCSELGDEFIKRRVASDYKYVIDKMPPNAHFIGLMYMMFPNAKFILTKRNALDCCFSSWNTIYGSGNEWTYSQEEQAKHYNITKRITDHWQDVLPDGIIHEVQYEDLVLNFEESVTDLCEYIGIEKTVKMNEFHKNKRKVNTASIGQVTTPLYSSSVNRTKNFIEYLGPMKEILDNDTI